MLAGAAVLVGVLVFVFGMPGTAPGDTPTATSTEPVATTADIFDMEPIVPEAKVSTEGWKTCRNEEYGYEFKFPAEWHIYGEDAYSDDAKPQIVQSSKRCHGMRVGFSTTQAEGYPININIIVGIGVDVVESAPPIFIREYAAEQQRKSLSTLRPMVLGGYLGILQVNSYVPLYGGRGWRLLVVRDGYSYSISGGNYDDQFSVFETILSTFHFLDTPTDPTITQE